MADPFTGGQASRASNALQKRQESLKRWTKSETAQESADRSRKKTKIQFSLGTVFLSAVSSGDVDEVKKLLAKGADINHQNVDGLTALHQACIDESYDLVKFLVDHGARMDVRDNEGWTALHAAASCGSVEIAQYLLDNGADVAAVNNEGELPLDLAEEEDMEDLLTDEIERLGIDVELARSIEERIMLEDAQSWMNGRTIHEIKDKSGATALHVAASKGYLQVISLLLQLGVDINAKDSDGWTPLHAAVHWGQNDACEVLAEHGANFSARNNTGSTPIDMAEPDMVKMLEELKKRQNNKPKINASTTPVIKSNMESGPAPLKRRSSITRIKDQNLFLRDINQERAQMEASMEQISPKSKLSRPPSFSESPKEDKENEREKRDGYSKEDSGSESDTEDSSEEDSEEDSEEEEQPSKPSVNSVAPRANVTVNSLPSKPTVNSVKKQPADESEEESEEETGSETEESSEEEEEEEEVEPVKPDTRTSAASSTRTPFSRDQSAPASVSGTSTLLKSPFLDNDKKANPPSSPVSKTESSWTSSLAGREETRDDAKSRFGNYPMRTTASTTSNATSTTNTRGRISSTPSEDTRTRTTRGKRVTQRAATSYVGSVGKRDGDDDQEEVEDRKSNDITHRRAGGDDERKDSSGGRSSRDETKSSSTRPSSTTDSLLSRRNRLSGTADDRSELDGRKAGRNKENEEAELPAWKRRLQEREKEKEREREKQREREKEKEKESEMPSYRRSRFDKEKEKEKEEKEKEDDDSSLTAAARLRRARRLKRRGGSDEEETEEVKDTKKNTNVDNDEKGPVSSRRRSQETRHEDTKISTDRIRSGRISDSKGPFGTSKANATTITETDPQKLKERLQEAQLELQEYKIKLEKALQAKEELERKYANVDDDLKQLSDLKADNQRLKDENGALIRVISKLSRPPT